MAILSVKQTGGLIGTTDIPGDKSISHRSIMLGALAEGETRITHFLPSDDCLNTIKCFRQLGVEIDYSPSEIVVYGRGLTGLQEPTNILDVGNSGTTIRLLSGILAGQPFTTFITGDDSIRQRPMERVTRPLQQMGAQIIGRQAGNLAPLAIYGGNLKGISFISPVASAQVKSAILLAGLFADGWTEIQEPAQSRDHTEIMMRGFGVTVEKEGLCVRLQGGQSLKACDIQVPGDISSAAFLLVAGCILPNTKLVLHDIGLNPTRSGIIDVLQAMGAKLTIENQQASGGELLGDIVVESSQLQGITIAGDIIPRLIDEIPVIALAAACANGTTEIRDAAELKVKESNRIATVAKELSKLGVDITELDDGLKIKGGRKLQGCEVESHGDHRIALTLAIAGLKAAGETIIQQAECIDVSFPNFVRVIKQLGGEAQFHD